jgi:hypothetical protein
MMWITPFDVLMSVVNLGAINSDSATLDSDFVEAPLTVAALFPSCWRRWTAGFTGNHVVSEDGGELGLIFWLQQSRQQFPRVALRRLHRIGAKTVKGPLLFKVGEIKSSSTEQQPKDFEDPAATAVSTMSAKAGLGIMTGVNDVNHSM